MQRTNAKDQANSYLAAGMQGLQGSHAALSAPAPHLHHCCLQFQHLLLVLLLLHADRQPPCCLALWRKAVLAALAVTGRPEQVQAPPRPALTSCCVLAGQRTQNARCCHELAAAPAVVPEEGLPGMGGAAAAVGGPWLAAVAPHALLVVPPAAPRCHCHGLLQWPACMAAWAVALRPPGTVWQGTCGIECLSRRPVSWLPQPGSSGCQDAGLFGLTRSWNGFPAFMTWLSRSTVMWYQGSATSSTAGGPVREQPA